MSDQSDKMEAILSPSRGFHFGLNFINVNPTDNNIRFPFRFFLITFIWSWICWTPLVLGSLKIIPVTDKFLSSLTLPIIIIRVFGSLAGALFALQKENGMVMLSLCQKINSEYGSLIKNKKRIIWIRFGIILK